MPQPVDVLPLDEHNRELVAQVHPADWRNPQPRDRYHLVVVGGGTAGLVAAAGAATLGARVALVEDYLLGGDCLNVGCVPSKAVIRSARLAAQLKQAGEFGIQLSGQAQVDFSQVMQRMRRLRAGISHHDSAARFQNLGVDVFLGRGRFTGRDSLQVGDQTLHFQKAVIATGTRPAVPPVERLSSAGFLTNETVFSLTELPARLAVVGGGPIGCELAQAFARFGSEVTLIQRGSRLLPRDDANAADIVQRVFKQDGIRLLLQSQFSRVETDGEEKILHLETEQGPQRLPVDQILVATGRMPNVEDLGLETAQVDYDAKTGVHVDNRLQTTNKRIYAAGDICSRYKFTHAADAMARLVLQNALFFRRLKADRLVIPWCTYTSPEVAHVGISEADAQRQEIPIQTFSQKLAHVDRAVLDGETEGFAKIYVQSGSDKILGATVVAQHAGEMIAPVTQAMTQGIGLKNFSHVIHPYPTQSEVLRQLGDAYNRSRLTPFVQSLFKRWFSWKG